MTTVAKECERQPSEHTTCRKEVLAKASLKVETVEGQLPRSQTRSWMIYI